MTSDTALLILAGLGLFFIGVKQLGSNLTQLAGPRLRKAVRTATSSPLLAAGLGSLVGIATQSTNAITFIVIGLVNSGSMAVRSALPVIAWANVGTSALVFLATVSIHDTVLAMVVVVGFAYYRGIDKSPRYRHPVGALLGLGLLFLGLEWIHDGSVALRGSETLRSMLVLAQNSPWLAFLLGAALTPVVQTAKTVSTITVALISAGLLGVDSAVMVVLGANFGSCANVLFMASNIRGRGRQLSIYQALLKVAGVVAAIPVLVLWWLDKTSPAELLSLLQVSPHVQVAIAYLALQVAAIAVLAPLGGVVERVLDRLSPITVEEKLSRPKYLFDGVHRDPETAALLVGREQERQVSFLPGYLEPFREDSEVENPLAPEQLRQANTMVMREIDECLHRVLNDPPSPQILRVVLNHQNRNRLIKALQDDLLEFAGLLATIRGRGIEHRMIGHLVEATHALLSMAPQALVESADPDTLEVLKRLTGDRPELMDRVRHSLGADENVSAAAQEMLFSVTMLFKRIIWQMRHLLILTEVEDTPRAEVQ
ncbi:putative Na+/Picotransporter [Candidatus Terasakiella magnetica]|nr:putative Na+/Picotransporter [Candidatus Terasakiella magnetica]